MALSTSSRSTFASFDKRSVLLFAALSLGGATALHAHQAPVSTAPGASTNLSFGPVRALPTSSQSSDNPMDAPSAASQAAFDRADANRDGQLSA